MKAMGNKWIRSLLDAVEDCYDDFLRSKSLDDERLALTQLELIAGKLHAEAVLLRDQADEAVITRDLNDLA